MTNELIFRWGLGLLLLAFMLHRGLQTRQHSPAASEIVQELDLGFGGRIANGLALVALLSSLAYLFFPASVSFAGFGLPDWVRWLAFPLALAGFILMTWAQRTLGKNWSDTPVQLAGHSLVTEGPYRWVRHPMYTAFLLILGAPLLVTANWLIGLSWITSTGLDIRARMGAEEAMLTQTFGEDYQRLAAKTGRLLPRLGG